MEMNTHAINWFEIPVTDFKRAKKFYSAIFDYEMPEMQMGPVTMGMLLYDQNAGGVGGAICYGDGYEPSSKGPKIYLNGGSDLNHVLNRVEGAGGSIALPKMLINEEIGYFASFMDTEGNQIFLHSIH